MRKLDRSCIESVMKREQYIARKQRDERKMRNIATRIANLNKQCSRGQWKKLDMMSEKKREGVFTSVQLR